MKGHRRRQHQALQELPEPVGPQRVMRVVAARGANLFDLQAAPGDVATFLLPRRLRQLVMIRPGSYVIAQPDVERRGTAGEIVHALLPEHVHHLQRTEHWPTHFVDQPVHDTHGGDDDPPSNRRPGRWLGSSSSLSSSATADGVDESTEARAC